MPGIKVSRQSPPMLGNGVDYKDILFADEQQVTIALTDWFGAFVSGRRAMNLVMNASGCQDILRHVSHAHVPIDLSKPGGKQWRVHVDFLWGKTATDGW